MSERPRCRQPVARGLPLGIAIIVSAHAGRRSLSDVEPDYTLFHRIAEPASARIRLRIVELGLKPRIDFQNAETDGRDELARLGGSATPALWDGRSLTVGEDQVERKLTAILPQREHGR